MDLGLLRGFVAVADAGSVTAAAAQLYLSQPTLSRQLHRLEREIDLVLFRPCDGRLVLTPAGRQLLPSVRTLLAGATAVRAFAREIATGAMGAVHVAALAVTQHDVLAPFIAAAPPNLPPLTVRPTDTEKLYDALDGDADLAVGANAPPAHLAVTILARLPVRAYVPATHRLAVNGSVTLTELIEHDLLLPDGQQHIRRVLDVATAEAGLVYRMAGEFESSLVALANAAAGRGVAVAGGDPVFDLVPLQVITTQGPMTAPLFAAWRIDHYAPSTLVDLATELSEYLINRHGTGAAPDTNVPRGSPRR
jgi:DNA-binding transcriptional LysR family regulator